MLLSFCASSANDLPPERESTLDVRVSAQFCQEVGLGILVSKKRRLGASAHRAVRFVKRALTGCSWPLLAVPGSSWHLLAAPGTSWPLLAPPGRSWHLLAAPGTSWLLLAVHIGLSSGEMMGSPAGKEPGRDAPATQMKRSAAVPGREPTCQLLLDGRRASPDSMVNGCPVLRLSALRQRTRRLCHWTRLIHHQGTKTQREATERASWGRTAGTGVLAWLAGLARTVVQALPHFSS